MLRYRLRGFEDLSLQQKKYIYFLSQATLAGRDITFDQFGASNLKIRKILETIFEHYRGDRQTQEFKALEEYLKQVWFSSGIHHHYNQNKFTPRFTKQFFLQTISSIPKELFDLDKGQDIESLTEEIVPIIFDPNLLKKRVCLDEGVDKVVASSGNYYRGVTQKEAEDFYTRLTKGTANTQESPSFGLNTTLVKENGALKELTWKVGGQYSQQIERIVYWLEKALTTCENKEQEEIINLLITYYKTGDLSIFDRYSIAWVAEKEGRIDFINGFIEVYGDPLGIKGSWEGIVHYKDMKATLRTQKICENAQWFEDNSPVDSRFKKREVRGITANVVCAAMLGGDEYPSSAIGINLPNADWIRSRYGSKSITIGNLTEAYNHASRGSGMREEFIDDESVRDMIYKYGDNCDDLHTDLHECLGHGSGQLLPGVSPPALREYGSTIEEARADLFGLYFIADRRLIDLGLMPNDEAYKAQYYTYLLNGLLTQMVRIPLGGQIEEAHMRNRAIISRWVMEHGEGVVSLDKHHNKTYLRISNYGKLRHLFALLLAEVQRIKSEGDYNAARSLVEQYGVKLDLDLHKEVFSRYQKLNIAPYKGFINPVLIPIYDNEDNIIDVQVDYSEDYSTQMLRYSRDF